jgi:hypothetical protein
MICGKYYLSGISKSVYELYLLVIQCCGKEEIQVTNTSIWLNYEAFADMQRVTRNHGPVINEWHALTCICRSRVFPKIVTCAWAGHAKATYRYSLGVGGAGANLRSAFEGQTLVSSESDDAGRRALEDDDTVVVHADCSKA